jgi:hypothetical protein
MARGLRPGASFGNALGEPVKQSLIGSRFRAACTRANLADLHFNDTNIQQTTLNASDEGLSAAMEKRHQAVMRRTLHAVAR